MIQIVFKLARNSAVCGNVARSKHSRLARFKGVLLVLCLSSIFPAVAAGPVSEAALKSAVTLYNQKQYAAAADAFEALIRSSSPNARLYYYAALANQGCNRSARAKQLSDYVVANFPKTAEASYAGKLFPSSPGVTSSGSAETATYSHSPQSDPLKGKSVAELMKTEEGRKALESALSKREGTVASAKAADSAKVSPMVARSKGGRHGERVFSATEIAQDGAGGIDQMYYPNCWFESSMSALAMLPRGQRLMADMIRYGPKEGTYVVRFPGDGVEYTINEEKLEKTGIHNKSLWATLIECAQTMKFPDDNGGYLHEGLGCLTGRKAESISPANASDQELSLFIQAAVKSQNPIVCGTGHYFSSGVPPLAIPGHAYTIVGFEPASGMIKIRNPHGANSRRFSLKSDPNHNKFEQMDDGVFKMHISLFKNYYSVVTRSFI